MGASGILAAPRGARRAQVQPFGKALLWGLVGAWAICTVPAAAGAPAGAGQVGGEAPADKAAEKPPGEAPDKVPAPATPAALPKGVGPEPLGAPAGGNGQQPAPTKDKDQEEAEQPRIRYDTVLSATGRRSTVYDSPRAASVVSRDELRSRPPRTTAEALDEEEGVFVQRTHHAGGSPLLRGLGGQRVVLLVDGIRLNTTITGPEHNDALTLVDPYLLESVEVVRGPASVLYGSGALGGVVHARTRRPLPIADNDLELKAGLRGVFTSYDLGGQGSLSASGRWGRYALESAFSARRFGELRAGSGAPDQPMTGYREGNLYVGTGADLGKGTLVLVYQGGRQYGAVRTDRSQPGDVRVLDDVARDVAYLRYTGSFDLPRWQRPIAVHATLSYQRQFTLESRLQTGLDQADRFDDLVNVGGVSAIAEIDGGRAGQISGGVEGYFEWVSSAARRAVISQGPGAFETPHPELARFPDGSTAQSAAVFLQDELDVERLLGRTSRPGRFRVLAGLRAGGNFVSITRDDRLFLRFPDLGQRSVRDARLEANPVYAGSLHARIDPWSVLGFVAGFSTGFRAPNLSDYARLGAEGRGGFTVPSTDLRPEIAYTGEAGVRAAFRKIEGSAFYAFTLLDGLLSPAPMTVAGQPCTRMTPGGPCADRFYGQQNGDRAQLHAVEVTSRLHLFGGLSVFGTLNYTYGTIYHGPTAGAATQPATSEPFYQVPPLNGVAALQLWRQRSIFSFAEVSLRWAAPQSRLAQADLDDPRICLPAGPPCTGTAGFAVLSLRGAARLSRYVQVSGAVENLTNTSYRYHGSGIDGPGVGATVSLDATY